MESCPNWGEALGILIVAGMEVRRVQIGGKNGRKSCTEKNQGKAGMAS